MLASRQTRTSYIITSKKTYTLTAAGTTPTSATSTYSYGYSSGTWGDLLTSYRDQAITYDAIGNPLSYYNGSSYTFSWSGRQLTGATKGGHIFTFTYNDEGIRTSKTKNGVTTTYYLNGSQIVGEETNGNITVYLYDSQGLPIGMQYHGADYATDAWDTYWFEKNLYGDIVAVYNQAGTKLVSYKYDAWGYTSITYHNSGSSTTATKNPFKYRGYYYDADLGLYYLNTRYYDSNTGRFISADGAMSDVGGDILGYNLYSYCFNNPIMYTDHTGNWPSWTKKFVAVVSVAVAITVATVVTAATCGAGSVAGVAMITATSTYALRTLEVFHLQKEKSENENKSSDEIKEDVVNAICANGSQIFGTVPLTKVAGTSIVHTVSKKFEKIFDGQQSLKATLKSKDGKIISFLAWGYEMYNTVNSLKSDNPIERAKERGYRLQ